MAENIKQAKGNEWVWYKSTTTLSMTSTTPCLPITCYLVGITAT
jgi:hypothetical protein